MEVSSPFPWVIFMYKIVFFCLFLFIIIFFHVFSETAGAINTRFRIGAFWRKCMGNLFEWFRTTELDGRHADIYLKFFLNLLLQNQNIFEAESWYIALGTQDLTSMFKWWSWVDL